MRIVRCKIMEITFLKQTNQSCLHSKGSTGKLKMRKAGIETKSYSCKPKISRDEPHLKLQYHNTTIIGKKQPQISLKHETSLVGYKLNLAQKMSTYGNQQHSCHQFQYQTFSVVDFPPIPATLSSSFLFCSSKSLYFYNQK